MSKKWQELELRNILQGLEEFATFMSYNSDLADMRIISVESVEQDLASADSGNSGKVLNFPAAEKNQALPQQHYRHKLH